MVAYLYADIEVTDPAGFADYLRDTPAIVAAHGGRYLARGGAVELLEGGIMPHRVALLEFPDMAHLKAFYDSPEYQSLITVRQRASRSHLTAVEGLHLSPPAARQSF